MLPHEWINHIGAKQVGAMNDDAITVPAQRAIDCGELARLRRREPETSRDKMLACASLEIVSAIENLARPGRELGFYPPIELYAAQTFVPDNGCTEIRPGQFSRHRRGAFDCCIDCSVDRFERKSGAV